MSNSEHKMLYQHMTKYRQYVATGIVMYTMVVTEKLYKWKDTYVSDSDKKQRQQSGFTLPHVQFTLIKVNWWYFDVLVQITNWRYSNNKENR